MSETEEPYGIGAVVKSLQAEFPTQDVSVSKIRFLETAGIVAPRRTPSGYRRFFDRDVERLRYTLRMQQDHFLPLKVIKEHLDQIDRGFEPPPAGEPTPRIPEATPTGSIPLPQLTNQELAPRLTAEDLAGQSGLSAKQITELLKLGVIAPSGSGDFSKLNLDVVRAVAALEDLGVPAKILRNPVFNSADKQTDVIKQLLTPQHRAASSDADRAAVRERAEELATALLSLQAMVVVEQLVNEYGGDDA